MTGDASSSDVFEKPSYLALFNAVSNASRDPFEVADILAALRGQGGSPPLRRAIFSDVSMSSLVSFCDEVGITRASVLASYSTARMEVAAANPELDTALAEAEAWGWIAR